MKLLLDENLSRRLVPHLQDHFPGSSQVTLLGLERASDARLCDYAEQTGFVLWSKDDDFRSPVAARGYRPRLVLLALGNATNDEIPTALVTSATRIHDAFDDRRTGIVAVS